MTPAHMKTLMEGATKRPWRADGCYIIANDRYVLDDAGSIDEDAAVIVAAVNALPALVALWEAAEEWHTAPNMVAARQALIDLAAALAALKELP